MMDYNLDLGMASFCGLLLNPLARYLGVSLT
jgi:hypothetical protein